MSLFLNGIETNTVMWNGIETTGYFNGNMVWGYTEPNNFTLLFSAASPVSAGNLSDSIANYDELLVCHGLPAYSQYDYIYLLPANSADYYIPQFVYNNSNQWIWSERQFKFNTLTSFTTTTTGSVIQHNASNQTWKKITATNPSHIIKEVWGVKYV